MQMIFKFKSLLVIITILVFNYTKAIANSLETIRINPKIEVISYDNPKIKSILNYPQLDNLVIIINYFTKDNEYYAMQIKKILSHKTKDIRVKLINTKSTTALTNRDKTTPINNINLILRKKEI